MLWTDRFLTKNLINKYNEWLSTEQRLLRWRERERVSALPHLNRAARSWCRWAAGSRWPTPACHVGSGSRWSQRWSARSQPWLTWPGTRDAQSITCWRVCRFTSGCAHSSVTMPSYTSTYITIDQIISYRNISKLTLMSILPFPRLIWQICILAELISETQLKGGKQSLLELPIHCC